MSKDIFPIHAQFLLEGEDQTTVQAALKVNTALDRTTLRIYFHEGMAEVRAATFYALSLAQSAITKLGGRDVQHLPQEEEIPMDTPVEITDAITFDDGDPDALAVAAE